MAEVSKLVPYDSPEFPRSMPILFRVDDTVYPVVLKFPLEKKAVAEVIFKGKLYYDPELRLLFVDHRPVPSEKLLELYPALYRYEFVEKTPSAEELYRIAEVRAFREVMYRAVRPEVIERITRPIPYEEYVRIVTAYRLVVAPIFETFLELQRELIELPLKISLGWFYGFGTRTSR